MFKIDGNQHLLSTISRVHVEANETKSEVCTAANCYSAPSAKAV